MVSEPFEVTDDNGITVTGSVDVFRDPKGPFYDPTSKNYQQPRYADANFSYLNTREACTIDRNVLSNAMQDAFAKALTRFGIKEPKPDRVRVAEDVDASINATREQCVRNADKYVSNETFSSTNWETGKGVGNLTARAYADVPAPGGGTQTVVAHENSWPAEDIAALRQYGDTGVRRLVGRVVPRDANDNEDWSGSSASDAVDRPSSPTSESPKSQGTMPATLMEYIRHLNELGPSKPNESLFDLNGSASPLAPSSEFVFPGRLDSFDDRLGSRTSSVVGMSPRQLNQSLPMEQLGDGEILKFYGDGRAQRPAGGFGDTAASSTPGPTQFLGSGLPNQNQLSGNKLQTPVFDPTNPPLLFAPPNYYPRLPDDSIQRWITSLAGVEPEEPAKFEVPPIFSPFYRS